MLPPVRPHRCAWGYMNQRCRAQTHQVFCQQHRAMLDQMVAEARQYLEAVTQ